ncbi:MAG TPA: NAD-dependent epimerase [Thermoanaerobaculia bacterium]|nr:NAD-dependent epimerase [Thermoanaerobaculia bacterium]
MVLVTGAAGFIGYHVARALLDRGESVVGLDNVNDYYDVSLKEARLARLKSERFTFVRADLTDEPAILRLFEEHRPSRVVHLAAQAGVRYSLVNPHAYVDSNVRGFLNILEACRRFPVEHLVFASSSSVYGGNTKQPFSEQDNVDHPVSLYAATKKANELMAHAYAHLFDIPVTGLRYFTVYGPWGRPDMAPIKFARAISAGEPIAVFNEGKLIRDFTYIEDVVEGTLRVLDRPPDVDPPYRIFNIGNNAPVPLLDFIAALEEAIGKKAKMDLQPMQPGDVVSTMADVSALERAVGYRPRTPLREGVRRFIEWFREYSGGAA